jgi:hypothetical protein
MRIHHPLPFFCRQDYSPGLGGLCIYGRYMHAQTLLLIPIIWFIYAWTKSLPQPQPKAQKRKQRKSRRKEAQQEYVPVICPDEDDGFMFSDDTDLFPDQSLEFPEVNDDSVFTDDDDMLTDITYSYMNFNIYHHDD